MFIPSCFEGIFDTFEVFFWWDMKVFFTSYCKHRNFHFSKGRSWIISQDEAEPGRYFLLDFSINGEIQQHLFFFFAHFRQLLIPYLTKFFFSNKIVLFQFY